MNDLRADLIRIITKHAPHDGVSSSSIPGLYCIKFSETSKRIKRRWTAAVSFGVQGCKEIKVGNVTYRYTDEVHYVVTPIDLAVASRISLASVEKPFLAIKMEFDAQAISEVSAQIEKDFPQENEVPLQAVFIGKANDKMIEAVYRLAKLLETPEDAPILGALLHKEILYHLLRGPDGPAIRQFVRSGSKTHKISETVFKLRNELTEEVDVTSLAKEASMSRSAFFKHFKEITAMSPIQYQKKFRLLEARRLMIDESETAEGSAYKVGYNSPSQFSREYSRMFGNPPSKDVVKMKLINKAIIND